MENSTLTSGSHGMVCCEHCKAENAPDKKFCTQCRFPIGGNVEERDRFQSDIQKNQILLKDTQDEIQSAKNMILLLAGFSMLLGIILYFAQDDVASFVVYAVICVLYLGLAAWCSSNPFGAILTAFIVYLTLQLLFAIADPVTIVSGIIWKIMFIGAFIKGIRSASAARTFMKELEKFKVEPVGAYYH
jgi:hypothetical protein